MTERERQGTNEGTKVYAKEMSEVQEEDIRRLAMVVEADAEAAIEVEAEAEAESGELDKLGDMGELGVIEEEQDIDQQEPPQVPASRNVYPEAETELELGMVDVRTDQGQNQDENDNDNLNLNPTSQIPQSILNLNLDTSNHHNDSTDLDLDSTTDNNNNDANVNALITLSSLASLGSLPPVPNLAPTSNLGVGGEMPTTTPEASGSGSRTSVAMGMSPGMNILLGLRAQGLQDSYLTYQNQDQDQDQNQSQNENHGYLPGMSMSEHEPESGRRSRSMIGAGAGASSGSTIGAVSGLGKSNGNGLAPGSANKRGRKRKAATINDADTGAGVQEEGITGAAASGMGSGGDEADGTDEQGQDQDQDQGGGRDGKRSKRAEQNRKAQQAFRKRREEKMKELEEKAREMERLHSAIDGGLRRVREVELENYELKMENQFLRSVVHSLSRLATGAGRTVLDKQGEFIMADSVRGDGVGTTSQTMESDGPGGSKEPDLSRQSDEARIELALTELRERSRIMAQAVDAQRRQPTTEQHQQQQASQPQIQPDLMQIDDHVTTPQQQPAASQALFLDPTQRNRPLPRSTILVSATPRNGIGCRGKVPWQTPSLGQFHHRVITGPETSDRSDLNAVIMSQGEWKRSTESEWQGVRSIVVSRTQTARNLSNTAIIVNGITSALDRIPWTPAKIFVVGGAWLFEEALTRDLVDRIIITRILDPAYDDCDAFLPDFHSIRELDPALWRRASHAELCGHVGFQVEPGVVEEDGVRYEQEMWIKV